MTAPAFDHLGLSDQPLIGNSTWTDERHLAAFGVIAALLFACHALGRLFVRSASYTKRRLSQTPLPAAGSPIDSAAAAPGPVTSTLSAS